MRSLDLTQTPPLGAWRGSDREIHFRVWAPQCRSVSLHLHGPSPHFLPMRSEGEGYFEIVLAPDEEEILYTYLLDGALDRPDPASTLQPRGVHGPSAVTRREFSWRAASWRGIPLRDYIIYELHLGTFTEEGTLDAAIARIPYLRDLGVTAVELMPVAAFPGRRNWGYDGVYPYAVQASYGGPDALKRFVDTCHQAEIAVVLDVVYNHLGPEGNYLRDFGPYFTSRYQTPWGEAINFDGPDSEPVRHFFLQNALYWITEFRIDALRLDATDTIHDHSSRHFLEELATAVAERAEALDRRIYTIAESAANDIRWLLPRESGGFGMDAQWMDDYHHALRHALTGETQGYFQDYAEFRHLAKGLREGFIYSGEYSAFRKRNHGNSSAGFAPSRFVVCAQNHDQVGNRMLGDRLGRSVPDAALRLAAAWVLLSPYIPLLFMGEEYNETAPFPYFVEHSDAALIEAVRKGRKHEFASFAWKGEPPDPQAESTWLSAKVNPDLRHAPGHAAIYRHYQELIRIRRHVECFTEGSREGMSIWEDEASRTICVRRESPEGTAVTVFHFSADLCVVPFPFEDGRYRSLLGADTETGGLNEVREIRHGEPMTLEAYALRVLERLSSADDPSASASGPLSTADGGEGDGK